MTRLHAQTLDQRLANALARARTSLATAESCTGGLIAHRITNIAGASSYFVGGVVVYSNEAKMRLLGVSERTLAAHGAVSEGVARELAIGVCGVFGSELGVSVTGIAGPGGGTADKPVGLVYIGWRRGEEVQVARFQFEGERAEIKAQTAEQALAGLLEWIE